MSAQHTPERLQLFPVGDNLEFFCPATEDGESILTITHEGNTAFAVVLSDINARRLVACWNACDGVPVEVLEAQQSGGLPWNVADQIEQLVQRDELLDSIKTYLEVYENHGKKPGWIGRVYDAKARLLKAIANATGRAT